MNYLHNTRGYLCGAMDHARDGGVGWRKNIQAELIDIGIKWLDPTDKPFNFAVENEASRRRLEEGKKKGNFDFVTRKMELIRSSDLTSLQVSDFMIVHIDLEVYACGTYEELTFANQLLKQTIIHCEQGKGRIPNWIFGMMPHETFFSKWSDVYDYLRHIDTWGPGAPGLSRWRLMNPDMR